MAIRLPKKIDSINAWIDVAACGLAKDAWVRVREETYAHYESARDESLRQGASEQHANAVALSTLGNARAANRQYKRIHLTEWESKLIRQDECAAKAIHARPYVLIIPLLFVCGAVAAFTIQPEQITLMMLIGSAGLSFTFGAPFLIPINTRLRGYVYRTIRLSWVVAIVVLPYTSQDNLEIWPMFFSIGVPVLWMIGWFEWSRASARRKLPIKEWPRTLYL
jgi:hypothetical protein